jgi:hypothetical protein
MVLLYFYSKAAVSASMAEMRKGKGQVKEAY